MRDGGMTPLERAARALCENPSEDPDEIIMMSDGNEVPRWRAELWRVRAVLTAIREPTEEMGFSANENVMVNTGHGFDIRLQPSDARLVWQAMIDAILVDDGKAA